MPTQKDYVAQMAALKQLSTIVGKKEEVEDKSLWETAGMKEGARLKDINAEIVKVKKLVSSQMKVADAEDEEEEEAPGDNAQGMRMKQRQDTRVKKDVRKKGADMKVLQDRLARGELDMKTDHVFMTDQGIGYAE